MAGSDSKTAVTFALIGNGLLTVIKFVAFGLSGSGAMLSEAIHSFADTGNQALLYIGIRRSERPPDAIFHYGFGVDRFFFALMSAVGIFVLGCGVTLYHGVHTLLHPPELSFGWIIVVVLAIALVVDGLVLWKAVLVVLHKKGSLGFLQYLRRSSDPTLAAVLLEDGVACLGVLVAGLGIFVSWLTGSTLPDSLATITIGLMMGGIAVWLGVKNRTLLLGRSIPRELQEEAIEFLRSQPSVEAVQDVKSRIVGAELFKLKAEVDWDGRALASGLTEWVESRRGDLDSPDGRAAFTRDFGEQITEALGDEIDRIEAALKERFPGIRYVDLESD